MTLEAPQSCRPGESKLSSLILIRRSEKSKTSVEHRRSGNASAFLCRCVRICDERAVRTVGAGLPFGLLASCCATRGPDRARVIDLASLILIRRNEKSKTSIEHRRSGSASAFLCRCVRICDERAVRTVGAGQPFGLLASCCATRGPDRARVIDLASLILIRRSEKSKTSIEHRRSHGP